MMIDQPTLYEHFHFVVDLPKGIKCAYRNTIVFSLSFFFGVDVTKIMCFYSLYFVIFECHAQLEYNHLIIKKDQSGKLEANSRKKSIRTL